jgi:hypothetical protein
VAHAQGRGLLDALVQRSAMTGLQEVLKRAAADLDAVGARWAITGGLAVATRAAPRFTQDVDFAVSVLPTARPQRLTAGGIIAAGQSRLVVNRLVP